MLRYCIVLLTIFTSLNVKANDWTPSSDTLSLINEQIKRNEISLAISYLPRVLAYMDDKPENFIDSAYVQISMELAIAYQINGDIQSSDKAMDNASLALEKRGINKIFSEFEFVSGIRQYQFRNYKKALKHFSLIKDREKYNYQNSNYLSLISIIVSCYASLNDTLRGNHCIEETLEIFRMYGANYNSLSKVQFLSNSGTFLFEQGKEEDGIQLIKNAYDIACTDSTCDGFHNKLIINLGTYYLNKEDYKKADFYYRSAKEDILNTNERYELLNRLFLLSYYVDKEQETCKYASEYCETLRKQIIKQFQNYSLLTLDNYWDNYCTQLKVYMGALHKYKYCSQLNSMCYDNALFIKSLPYNIKTHHRKYINTHPEIKKISDQIKELRQLLFFSYINGQYIDEYRDSISNLEETMLKIQDVEHESLYTPISWKDVKNAITKDEVAIEIISSAGFYCSKESPKLKLGALIVYNDSDAPQYIELCDNDLMQDAILKSYAHNEMGINQLYTFNGKYTLFNLLWKNIEPFVKDKKKIYISPILSTQNINWGFIPCPDGKYLNDKYEIQHLSTTASLLNREILQHKTVAIFGDMNYSQERGCGTEPILRGLIEEYEENRGNFLNLNFTKEEIDSVRNILTESGFDISMYSKDNANESSFRSLDGHSPSIIHISSHAYYLVGFDKFNDYFNRLTPLISRDENMIRSGILFNMANKALNSISLSDVTTDGVLTAEEISTMDLSNTDMVVISACESMIGCSNEGLGGLPKAFKLAGVRSVLGSLWKVSDGVTSLLMNEFYQNLSKGLCKNESLIRAQYKIRELYPDPYYWAAFILLD